MVHAYIMVKTGAGTSERICEEVRDLAGVVEAHVVAGTYDLIVETGGDEVYDVLSTAAKRISAIEGVNDTKTYIALSD